MVFMSEVLERKVLIVKKNPQKVTDIYGKTKKKKGFANGSNNACMNKSILRTCIMNNCQSIPTQNNKWKKAYKTCLNSGSSYPRLVFWLWFFDLKMFFIVFHYQRIERQTTPLTIFSLKGVQKREDFGFKRGHSIHIGAYNPIHSINWPIHPILYQGVSTDMPIYCS